MSKNARDFIDNLVKKNPNERIKSYRLLEQSFLKKK
jgi:serine/threonine protein kinase